MKTKSEESLLLRLQNARALTEFRWRVCVSFALEWVELWLLHAGVKTACFWPANRAPRHDAQPLARRHA